MDMDTMAVAGGVLLIITLPAGADGTAVQGLMVSMEIISMYIIIFMLTTRTMYIGAGPVYQARVIIAEEVLLPER